jgi:hypothetical protein
MLQNSGKVANLVEILQNSSETHHKSKKLSITKKNAENFATFLNLFFSFSFHLGPIFLFVLEIKDCFCCQAAKKLIKL